MSGMPGEGHVGVVQDLTDVSAHPALVRRARDELGGLWGIAHMAAVLRRRGSVTEVTEEDWDVQIDVNLKAAFFLCREVGLALQELGRGGRIVTFSSQGWWTGGFGGSVVYSASKGGVTSFSRGLARTFGAANITVNTVSPGAVETPMLLTGLTDEDVDNMEKVTPLGRMAQPHELAGPVVFLLSQHASFLIRRHVERERRLADVLTRPSEPPAAGLRSAASWPRPNPRPPPPPSSSRWARASTAPWPRRWSASPR